MYGAALDSKSCEVVRFMMLERMEGFEGGGVVCGRTSKVYFSTLVFESTFVRRDTTT